jgi:hypothetical protein
MDDVINQGIPEELHQAVLARTWKIEQQIGHDSAMKGIENKVWTESNAPVIGSNAPVLQFMRDLRVR